MPPFQMRKFWVFRTFQSLLCERDWHVCSLCATPSDPGGGAAGKAQAARRSMVASVSAACPARLAADCGELLMGTWIRDKNFSFVPGALVGVRWPASSSANESPGAAATLCYCSCKGNRSVREVVMLEGRVSKGTGAQRQREPE